MKYLVMVEKTNGKMQYYTFWTIEEATEYRNEVVRTARTKAAWVYQEVN